MKFSSLAAQKVVILITFRSANDENFIIKMTFLFECMLCTLLCFAVVRLQLILPISLTHLPWNGRHFADNIIKRIFLNENVLILFDISLKFVPNDPFDNNLALV